MRALHFLVLVGGLCACVWLGFLHVHLALLACGIAIELWGVRAFIRSRS